jgi:dipeptidyl aminopeptidase/acylaminoacyl peptidase
MKRSVSVTSIALLHLALLVLLAGCASGPKAPDLETVLQKGVPGEVPPLIDRELFFGDPDISGSQLSPDGRYISFIKPYNEVRNIWVRGIDEPFGAARPLTADERPVVGYFWSQDGRYVLYVQDKGGNENWHVYAVDPMAQADSETGVPPARDLTPLENVTARIFSVPKNNPKIMIIGLNDRDKAYHDVYKVDIATGERELLIENTQKVASYSYDLEGNVRLAVRQMEDGGTEVLRVDGDDLVQIYTCTYREECFPYRFHKDGKRCYFVTNKGENVDLTRLMLLDPMTGQTEFVESDPEKEVDFGGAAFSDDTDELIATWYVGDRVRIYPKTKQVEKDLEFLHKNLPDGELGFNSTTRDMNKWLVSISRDVDPGSVYLYDRKAKSVELIYRGRPDLPTADLAPMFPVRYTARDGLEIPAYLTLPKGVIPHNLPVVILPHGGPWARDHWGYDPYPQFLANRGYAVLQPNFRSSSGYGKSYLNAGNKTWGTGPMQHDITDGVKWLIAKGIADPKRVSIFGGSYGGYATLAGVTFTPDLYACGVPYVAPSNIITLTESFPAYWRPFLKGGWYMRVGDPEIEEDRQDMAARSPINFVDNIKVPLLVIHGANDPRVKQVEADRIVVALRDKGMPVEYIVAPDEGHGFRAPLNRMAFAAAMEKFLAKHLGGRYQEAMTDEVRDQLAKITVDPATVTLASEEEKALQAAAETAPLPEADGGVIKPATLAYGGGFEMGGQKIDMDVSRVIEAANDDDRACWKITDEAKMVFGNQKDSFLVDKATLLPIRREAEGMGMMKLAYSDDAITGQMGGGGQTMDVNEKLAAPVVGDGPAFELMIAGLPLAEGYAVTVRQFDAMSQKVRPFMLKVTGKETVAVQAGSYETWVLELKSLDDDEAGSGTLHAMLEAPHHLVKGAYKLPAQMGGGIMTAELK